ncbi:hypothetical protein [Ruegeria atlantica]|uniref:hypothetical protein n=1 Tax=Ruegeria atlantica TaxID=81569 RepID=UPI001480BB45|nr:hypothetical protein [Ruegeria atlantica]
MNENFSKSLDRLAIHLSKHCRNYRLVDLNIESLSADQRRSAITATLDFFEHEIARRSELWVTTSNGMTSSDPDDEHQRKFGRKTYSREH